MRRQTRVPAGRRGTVLAASAAVLFLGGALAGCGGTGGDNDGYTALGAAATGPGKAPSGAVAPSDDVTLIPLDGARSGTKGGGDASPSPGAAEGGGTDPTRPGGPGSVSGPASDRASGRATGSPGSPRAPGTPGTPGSPATGTTAPAHGPPGTPSTKNPGSPTSPAPPSSPTTPADPTGPAVLHVGAPVRAAADDRWCEKVTVEFRNTGGAPVRSGTVTFATHVIGGLGVDWATLESTAPLPAPIDAGAARKKTYTVCVDAWRVPLGMHVETRGVTAAWK